MTEHETEEKYVEFEMNIVGIFKNPLSRIVNEGVRIKQRKDEELLNSKTEYHGPIVRRKVIETSWRNQNRHVFFNKLDQIHL